MVITILLRKLNAEDHLAKPDGIILRWKNTILFDLLYILFERVSLQLSQFTKI
jgi:hypothetical protein